MNPNPPSKWKSCRNNESLQLDPRWNSVKLRLENKRGLRLVFADRCFVWDSDRKCQHHRVGLGRLKFSDRSGYWRRRKKTAWIRRPFWRLACIFMSFIWKGYFCILANILYLLRGGDNNVWYQNIEHWTIEKTRFEQEQNFYYILI